MSRHRRWRVVSALEAISAGTWPESSVGEKKRVLKRDVTGTSRLGPAIQATA